MQIGAAKLSDSANYPARKIYPFVSPRCPIAEAFAVPSRTLPRNHRPLPLLSADIVDTRTLADRFAGELDPDATPATLDEMLMHIVEKKHKGRIEISVGKHPRPLPCTKSCFI